MVSVKIKKKSRFTW